ncbi:hypothetical protein JCM6882_002903 [Rhodosporidiobolus microsporus]
MAQSAGKVVVDHSFRLSISAAFDDFNIEDESSDVPIVAKDVPWPGTWALEMQREEGVLLLGLTCNSDVPVACLSKRTSLTLSLAWVGEDGVAHLFPRVDGVKAPPNWAHRQPGSSQYQVDVQLRVKSSLWTKRKGLPGQYKSATHRSYLLTATFEEAYPEGLPSCHAHKNAERLARRITGINLEQLPHDVRLFFPLAHTDGAELWAKSNFLSGTSPYLETLLSSAFAEATPRRSKRARTSGAFEVEVVSKPLDRDYDDSDDETDTFLFSKRPPKLDPSSEADEVSYRQITITQTAFSTYHAVLVYLQTGFIHFTPLSSSLSSTFPSRTDFLSQSFIEKPALPLPVSPKSAYRLAHLLQLPDLQTRSLDAFRSSLSASNAAAELFTDSALAYDELRAVVVEVVKANWAAVRESQGWKDKTAAIKRDEVPGGGAVLVDVLQAVAGV